MAKCSQLSKACVVIALAANVFTLPLHMGSSFVTMHRCAKRKSGLRVFRNSMTAQAMDSGGAKAATVRLPVAVNWHLEPRCNFACKFCYAHFYDAKKPGVKAKIELGNARRILSELRAAGVQKVTFVGGEPLLHPDIMDLVKWAKVVGLTTCIVTNGSLLNKELLRNMKPYLDWLGISIDASTDELHLQLGRASKKDLDRNSSTHLAHVIGMWKEAQRLGYGLKLNTVVSRPTLHHDMSALVLKLRPDRWKVFHVLPISGENDDEIADLEISSEEFDEWVRIHRSQLSPHGIDVVAESNEDMRGTYAMMDWQTRFYTNREGKYVYGPAALEVGVAAAWGIIESGFDTKQFAARGGVWDWETSL